LLLSPSKIQIQEQRRTKLFRHSVAPLLIGTFILRVNGGAAPIILGRLLAQLSLEQGHVISNIHVGLIAVTYFVVELTLAPVMGALSDRMGRRFFLTLGPIIGMFQVVLLVFTPTQNPLPYLLFLQVLAGVSTAMQVPAVLGYLADYTADSRALRMRVMSLYELATTGGFAIGVVLGGFAWDRFGREAYALLAAGYLIVAICMSMVPTVHQVIERSKLIMTVKRYWGVLRTPRLFIFIPAWISFCALAGIWLSTQLTFILSSTRHNPHQSLMGIFSAHGGGGHLSLVLGAFVMFFGLSLLFWAFFLNKVPRVLMMLSSITGIFLFCIALAGINHFGMGHPVLMAIWILLLLVGIFAESSFAPAALAYLADISEDAAKDRGLLMGLYSVFLGLGQLLGGALGAVFAQIWGFDGLIYLTAMLACVALIALLTLFQMERRMGVVYGIK
jgi:MFS family permease